MCCIILLPVACLVTQYFSTLIHKCHGFWKNVTEQKIELWFSVQFSSKNSYSQKRYGRYYHKCAYMSMSRTRYVCQILRTREFSRKSFEKYSNTNFNENPSSERQVVPRGRTDGQTDMTKLIVTCRNFANVPRNKKFKARQRQDVIFSTKRKCVQYQKLAEIWRNNSVRNVSGWGLNTTCVSDIGQPAL
jgi:hypothetical protein